MNCKEQTDMLRIFPVRNAELIADACKSNQTADLWGQACQHSDDEYNEQKGARYPWCIMKNINKTKKIKKKKNANSVNLQAVA